MLNLFSLLYIG